MIITMVVNLNQSVPVYRAMVSAFHQNNFIKIILKIEWFLVGSWIIIIQEPQIPKGIEWYLVGSWIIYPGTIREPQLPKGIEWFLIDS